ncbi:hypothetical protein [Photorhabdus australis]|uniref:hypothetical protein n=1 Tax=Photorhabdus australis TaxID=286156 RepID=UPI0030D86B6B
MVARGPIIYPAQNPASWYIPFIFQAAALLTALTYSSHIVIYAPGDAFTCRRTAT